MQIKALNIGGTTTVEVIDPTDGAVAHSLTITDGNEVVINAPIAASPADVEVGEVTPIAEPEAAAAEGGATDEEPATDGTDAGGSAEPPAPEDADSAVADLPTTSAVSGRPLYRVLADTVPDGFIATALKTPDGFTLYTFDGDTGGAPHTAEIGEGDQVALYAEAEDDSQPVLAPIAAEGGEVAP